MKATVPQRMGDYAQRTTMTDEFHQMSKDPHLNNVESMGPQGGHRQSETGGLASFPSSSTLASDADDDIALFPTSVDAADFHPVVPENLDSILASEMAALSMREREEALYDLHGVSESKEPSGEIMQQKIEDLKECLKNLTTRSDGLLLAEQSCSEYIYDSNFLVSFLRADGWDPIRAADRISKHFQAKKDLFGIDKLCKDITQDDLHPEALEALYSGLMQYLPLRDRAGRLIHVSFQHPDSISLHAKLQRTFYMSMVSSEDTETQQKGRIAIGYLTGQSISTQPRNDWQVGQLLQSLPVRIDAVHLCHDKTSVWGPIFSVFKYVVTLFMRLRLREHFGKPSECKLKLQTFGIPADCLPITTSGDSSSIEITNTLHTLVWQKRAEWERMKFQCKKGSSTSAQVALPSELSTVGEDTETNPRGIEEPSLKGSDYILSHPEKRVQRPQLSSAVLVPAQNDVLLGRGKGFYQHTGNIRFRHAIENLRHEYDTAMNGAAKKAITIRVIDSVHQRGGRFLKDDSKIGWRVVGREVARQKVAHCFRAMRTERTPNIGQGEGSSSTSKKSALPTAGSLSPGQAAKRVRR